MSVANSPRLLSGVVPQLSGTTIWRAAAVAAICVLPILLYLPFLHEPLFRDEGLYAAVGQRILDGGIPYRDAFDNKPPMIFAYYALSFVLFGENLWAPRLLVALMLSGTTWLMYLEGRMLWDHRSGMVAAVAFGLSFGLATLETNANTEFFMIPALVAAIACFTANRRSGNAWWLVGCGLFTGVAMATKDISLFTFLLYATLLAWPRVGARQWGRLAREQGALALGCVVAALLVLGPFLATGTMDDLFDATIVYTLDYVGHVPLETKVAFLRKSPMYLLTITGPWMVMALIAAWSMARGNANTHAPLLLGWLAANWLGIIAAGRFYDHYYVALLPPLALMAPVAVQYISSNWKRSHLLKVIVAGYLPLSVLMPLTQNLEIYAQPTPAARHEAKFSEDRRAPWENQGPVFGQWINARTSSSDYIYNFGFQSELYFYSDRRSPTRYLMDRPFWQGGSHVERALAELEANPPVYVIDSAIYEDWAGDELYTEEIKDWVTDRYDYVGKVYYADVYRIKENAR